MSTEDLIRLLIEFGLAIISLLAAIYARRSAKLAESALGADVIYRFFESYTEPKMCESLRILRKWKTDNGPDFDAAFDKQVHKPDPDPKVLEVDAARRHVLYYFATALHLYNAGALSKRFLKEIADLDGLKLQEEIVEKLERKLNPESRDRDISERIHKIVRLAPVRSYAPVSPTPKSPDSPNV